MTEKKESKRHDVQTNTFCINYSDMESFYLIKNVVRKKSLPR